MRRVRGGVEVWIVGLLMTSRCSWRLCVGPDVVLYRGPANKGNFGGLAAARREKVAATVCHVSEQFESSTV